MDRKSLLSDAGQQLRRPSAGDQLRRSMEAPFRCVFFSSLEPAHHKFRRVRVCPQAAFAVFETASQWLAWVPSAAPADVTAANVRLLAISKPVEQIYDGRVTGLAALKFGNLELVIQAETYVAAADPAGAVPVIRLTVNPVTGRTLTLQQTNTSRSLDLPVDATFDVPLASAALGAWRFPMSPNRDAFYQLFQDPNDFDAAASAEIRMSYESGGTHRALRYPLLLGALADPQNPPEARLPMKVSLDVLNPLIFSELV